MTTEDFAQRQPRSGTRKNHARTVYNSSDRRYEVQLLNLAAATTSYSPVLSVESEWRATAIVERLNNIFANSRADLDFIAPGISDGYYIVQWSGTTWLGESVYVQKTECGNTYEDLYRGCKLPYFTNSGTKYYDYSNAEQTVIATVTDADEKSYGMKPWEISLLWANKIRGIVNGWNCSKDSTFKLQSGLPWLVNEGYIYRLIEPNTSYKSTYTLEGSYYGAGEIQPGPTTANGEIFHTLCPTVAMPGGNTHGLDLNMWVRVTYGNKSVVARVTDQCGTGRIDLSCGLANALGFGTSNDIKVTISAP